MGRIGIAGTGRMGTAFAKRLVEAGKQVSVWNRTSANTEAARLVGARVVGKLAELADADAILISLTDADAVHAVADDLIAAGVEGRLVIDLSTLMPDASRDLARRFTDAGADHVECPVGGTVAPALKGQLLGLAGSSPAAYARAKPILDLICRRVEHLGPAGAGAQMKLAINLPLAIYWQTLAEAMALLAGSGIATERAIDLIADSSAGPTVLKNRAKVAVDTLNGDDQPGTFDLQGLRKDLGLALQFAEAKGQNLPLSQTVRPSYDRAIAEGLGGFDGATLTRHLLGRA